MKCILLILLIGSIPASFAKNLLDRKSNRSLGGSIGSIWAITYQMPYRDSNALAYSVGFGGKYAMVYADMFWYQPQISRVKEIVPYIATGAGVSTEKNDFGDDVSIFFRAPIGANYHLNKTDIDLFGHIVPQINTNGGTYLGVQIGLNYIF